MSSIEEYNKVKCPTCGRPWSEHPIDTICDRHRPKEMTPPLVLSGASRWLAERDAARKRVKELEDEIKWLLARPHRSTNWTAPPWAADSGVGMG